MTDEQIEHRAVVAYIRKSSEDNEKGEVHKQLNSLEYQREFVKEAVEKYKLKLLRQPFEDDKTGYEAFIRDGENGFNQMLEFIKNKKNGVEGIICTEISRLARNFADGGMVLWYLQNENIKYIYTPTKVFTNSSSDQLMVAIEFAMSKKSSDEGSYRTKQGMKSKALTMKHPARPAILGYKTEGPEGAKRWVIDEKLGPLVKKVFAQFATGKYTFDQIAEYAYEIGIRSYDNKSKTSKLSANTWRNRLKDEQYVGVFYHNGERIGGEYSPLIEDVTFYAVQEIIKGNQHPKQMHIDYAYSGLIKCGLCGDLLSGTNKKGITYYRCGKRKSPCKDIKRKTYFPETALEENLVKKFSQIEIDQEVWKEARNFVSELNQPEKINLTKDIRKLGEQIETEDKFQLGIGEKFVKNLITKTQHDRLMKASYAKQNSFRESIVKLERISLELNQLMESFLDNIKFVTRKFQTALPVNKREMVDIFCENLVWKDRKVDWNWKNAYFILANQPKNSSMLRE